MAASEAVPTPASTISGSGEHLAQDADVGLVLNAHAAADGRAQGHDGGRAGVDQALGNHNVVRGIRQNRKAFLHQDAGRFDGRLHVGIERGLVADDLDLHPVGEADFAAQAGGADGIVGGVAAGGVGQQKILLGIDEVEQRFLAAVEVHAADGDGDHLGAAGFDGARGLLARLVLARCRQSDASGKCGLQ